MMDVKERFLQWELFVVKAAIVLGVMFTLVGLGLGPLAPSIGAGEFTPSSSVMLGFRSFGMIFILGTLLNVCSSVWHVLRDMLGK